MVVALKLKNKALKSIAILLTCFYITAFVTSFYYSLRAMVVSTTASDDNNKTINGHYNINILSYSQQDSLRLLSTGVSTSTGVTTEENSISGQDLLDWGVDDIDAERVWGGFEDATDARTSYTGYGITVAVIDTGINYNHPDLDDNYIGGLNYYDDYYHPTQNLPADHNGHGTHCAGIIAAEDNNMGVIGVAPDASLYAVKITEDGESISPTYLIQAINDIARKVYNREVDVDIISISLGTPSLPETYLECLQDVINNAYNKGIIVVAAAGNGGSDSVDYPARLEHVIAVGAINEDHQRAAFSNYGAELDLVAPGVNINSTYSDENLSPLYKTLDGTSMAAPMVAGVCALILSANRDLTPDNVTEILKITANDLGEPGRDNVYGWGEVNASRALDAARLCDCHGFNFGTFAFVET